MLCNLITCLLLALIKNREAINLDRTARGAAWLRKSQSTATHSILLRVWLAFLLVLVMLPLGIRPAQAEPTAPGVTAQAAIAVDASTGQITYAKNIHRRLPMASTTKIMTALTALAIPGTNLNDRYTATKDDMVGANETSMYLREGETVTFSDLLYGMLLNSGNDAALAVAHYGGGKLQGSGTTLDRFIARMNQQAVTFGLRNTHFVNPHGLDSKDHYSSAFDLAIMGWYALHNPTISQIVKQQKATVAGHQLTNLNTFLKTYPGATGIKPGYDDLAGLCLVASATRNGQTGIAVALNTDQAGYTGDATTMLNYTFDLLNQPGGSKNKAPAGSSGVEGAQFIGVPKGDVLLPGANAVVGSDPNNGGAGIPANGVSNANPYLIGGGPAIAAQINPTPLTQFTPSTDDGSGGGGGGDNNNGKKEGGPNFLVILLIILIIGFIAFGLARAGYLGGDNGRNLALQLEDMAVVGLRSARGGAVRLFNLLKPGNHPEELPAANPRENPSAGSAAKPFSSPSGSNFRERVNPHAPAIKDEPATGSSQNPSRPRTTSGNDRVRPNPLDGFFDDVQPFGLEEKPVKPATPTDSGTTIKPPQPIPPIATPTPLNRTQTGPVKEPEKDRPVSIPRPIPNNHPNRTAAEPQQKPDLNSPVDRLRPPQPLSPRPATPTPPPASNSGRSDKDKADKLGERNYFSGSAFNSGGSDSLTLRARQAIDYAYAGRLQASTDEFRKVVEQDPLFDFGTLEEFEQMPVLGFKALASAYHSAGRSKFALLLLDMGIEKYPNDLELRNMLRTLKRET